MAPAHSRSPQNFPVICCRKVGGVAAGVSVPAGLSRAGVASQRSFLAREEFHEFRQVLAGLRALLPPAKPVVVRTSWMPSTTLGECAKRPQTFVIRLNDQMTEAQAVETLLHEWAHALAWNFSLDRLARMPGVSPEEFSRASHDEAWGCAYSRVWRAYTVLGVG